MSRAAFLAFVTIATACSKRSASDVVEAGPPTVPSSVAVSDEPLTPMQRAQRAATLTDALLLAKPEMREAENEPDLGTLMLAAWATRAMRWSDVFVTKDETSYLLVQKDPDAERGKRLCVSGSVIEIHAERTAIGKFFDGGLLTPAGSNFRFIAVGSTGSIVQRDDARFCGIVTTLLDYKNSAGGTSHAVQVVGMFDLPENRATAVVPPSAPPGALPLARAPVRTPTVATSTSAANSAPATAPAPPANSCVPPYVIDENGRKKYKTECIF